VVVVLVEVVEVLAAAVHPEAGKENNPKRRELSWQKKTAKSIF